MRLRWGTSLATIAATALFVGASALLLLGCGEDSTNSSAAPPIDKASFVKKANAICKATRQKLISEAEKVVPRLEKEGKVGPDASAELAPTYLVPGLEDELEEIRALGAPAGDEDEVEAILTAIQKLIVRIEKEPTEFFRSLANFEHPDAKAVALAKRYGIEVCAHV